jgi:hypothetical protein
MRKSFAVIITLILISLTCACNGRRDPILFSDNFSRKSSGWNQFQDESGVLDYASGKYHISVTGVDSLLLANPGQSFDGDVSIEVDAVKIGGPDDNYFGVLCRYQDPDNYYMLMITSDGYSGIVLRWQGQDYLFSPGRKFIKMDGIELGEKTNHIRADCIGNTLTLYANGIQVSTATDPKRSLNNGDVGLAARSGSDKGGVDIQFDNFRVYQP